MAEAELDEICQEIGNEILNLYAALCVVYLKPVIITAMTGALCACASEAGFSRQQVIAGINSCFDDIEAQEG